MDRLPSSDLQSRTYIHVCIYASSVCVCRRARVCVSICVRVCVGVCACFPQNTTCSRQSEDCSNYHFNANAINCRPSSLQQSRAGLSLLPLSFLLPVPSPPPPLPSSPRPTSPFIFLLPLLSLFPHSTSFCLPLSCYSPSLLPETMQCKDVPPPVAAQCIRRATLTRLLNIIHKIQFFLS